MAKLREGYVGKENDRWFARTTFTDSTGRRRNVKRLAKNESDAKQKLKILLRKLDDEGEKGIHAERITFKQLADYYEKHFCITAKYSGERKVGGLRDVGRAKGILLELRKFFGSQKIRTITYGDLVEYKNSRLGGVTHLGKPRSLSTLNREMGILRRMLNIAAGECWILRNPFNNGDSLIQPSADGTRKRILTLQEEQRLLAACQVPCRSHIRPLLIALLDTGARRGEMLKLTWECVDFEKRLILIKSRTTKTLKARHVGMTNRLAGELRLLWDQSAKDLMAPVFGVKAFRKAFTTACKLAGLKTGGIDGIVVHSLRHTTATRLVKGQMSIQLAGKILGHQNVNTTFRYLSANDETLHQAASILDAVQQE